MKREFLLEIGCEEIPAGMLPEASLSLRQSLDAELKEIGLLGTFPVESYPTPRRLVAYCPDLPPKEPDRTEEVVGPPRAVALDATGKPTQAAKSFAAKHGVKAESLRVVSTPKGEYMAITKRTRGQPTREVLPAIILRVISAIRFPRAMYWTSRSGVRFIRPIRWLLALYAGQLIRVEVGDVQAGRTTWGHRVLSGKPFTVHGFKDYVAKLRRAKVIVDPNERARKIAREQQQLLRPEKLRYPAEETEALFGVALSFDYLLQYAVNSTEYPSVILGQFDPAFARTLPEEILRTVMVHHQKYFYLRDKAGRLAPYFLAVIDRDRDSHGLIRRGHERVLRARFRDAQFFWDTERKSPLDSRLAQLAGVTFAQGLGSYAQKSERLARISHWLTASAAAAGRHADTTSLIRAARLCKCDLTTQLVGEFPELQGIVGGLYAQQQGEPEKVWRALYEHYQPQRAGDSAPTTLEGALLALADKMDTLVACLAVGLEPSGSSDPFGLRRAAQGAVKIILDHRLRVQLEELIEEVLAALSEQRVQLTRPRDALSTLARDFLLERARNVLASFAYDELNAVLAASSSDLVDVHERLKALRHVRPSPHFEPLSVAFKRIRNILEQAGDQQGRTRRPVDPGRLEPGAERDLFDTFERLRPQVAELCHRQDYAQALRLIASLRPHVDRFFDRVLVMADDPVVRENRLTLLAHLLSEFSSIADFAELVPTSATQKIEPTKEGHHA